MSMMLGLWLLLIGSALFGAAGLVAAYRLRRRESPRAPLPGARRRRCPHCGAVVDADEVICPACQRDLRTNCPHCGEVVDVTAKRCPACRRELPQVRPLPPR